MSSFSEVEQTRAHLQALARRRLYLLQRRQIEQLRAVHTHAAEQRTHTAVELEQLIEEFERARAEFRGTPKEAELTLGLLNLLARVQADDRWLDVYLEMPYRRPTDSAVGRLADRAVVIGCAVGRLDAV